VVEAGSGYLMVGGMLSYMALAPRGSVVSLWACLVSDSGMLMGGCSMKEFQNR